MVSVALSDAMAPKDISSRLASPRATVVGRGKFIGKVPLGYYVCVLEFF
jgi:hypothetical protein